MDYKNTLNLPRTDFAMKADLVTREPQRLDKWEKENLYGKIQDGRKDAEKFVLHERKAAQECRSQNSRVADRRAVSSKTWRKLVAFNHTRAEPLP